MAKYPDQTHLRAFKSSVKSVFEMSQTHVPVFHFEIGVLLFLSINTL